MEQIQGIIKRITFQSEETGFTVLSLQDEKTNKIHTCVGTLLSIEQGESVKVCGEWIKNKRFGLQFSVKSYELIRPTTITGIQMFLSSGLIPDIGPNRAQNIIDTFGLKTLDIIDKDPKKLITVPGIGKKRLNNIIAGWQQQKHIKDLMLFLYDFNISVNLINKIHKAYGIKAKEVISANPYKLIDDIWGVGFKKADTIAKKLGFRSDSYRRIRAGIIYTLQEAGNEGHTFLPEDEIIEKATKLLAILQENLIYSLDHACQEKIIIKEDDRLYLPKFYYAEKSVAEMLIERINYQNKSPVSFNGISIDTWIQNYSKKTGWQGDEKQIAAVKTAIENKIVLITGGPGTGKTTTLQVIVSFFRELNVPIALTAPTGRAAQRMGTLAGINAQTIHRLLEYNMQKKGSPFTRNAENPIPAEILICDETSMIDIILMKNLLSAIRSEAIVILVGDNNQLPSVGAGNVLSDMIKCKKMPHIKLTTIFRQAAKSRIVTAAHDIIQGVTPAFKNIRTENCFFITEEDSDKSLETIIDLVSKRLPASYNINPVTDIQILSPMHNGTLGTKSINRELQKRLNPSDKSITYKETIFSIGDKVMQIRNNYESGVFNGDIGVVSNLYEETGLVVNFGQKNITYERKDLDELTHAYCISIHKSQGCEFNTVIIPVSTKHYIMLQRNLIYTALTRARNICILIGSLKALSLAVKNNKAFQRYSSLSLRLNPLI